MSNVFPDQPDDVLLRALEQSPIIVVITDIRAIVQYVNPFFCKVTGYSRDEVVGQHVRRVTSRQNSPDTYAKLWSCLNAGQEWTGEFHNRRKDGSLYWEKAALSPIRNAAGVTEHYMKLAEDITRQKEVEDELLSIRRRYETVVIAVRGFMFTVLMEKGQVGRTIYFPGTQQVTGYSVEEYETDPQLWSRMILDEDLGLVGKQIHAVIDEHSTRVLEHRIRHKDGSIRWIRNVSVPSLNAQGEVVSYDGLIADITELKNEQAQREALTDELRQMATLDSLTGLFSRRGFHAEFERIWQLGDRQQMQTGLMIMDIDHFKVLNDTYGHPVGDQILVEAAQMIGTNVRAGDVVCRYGGDEMVVILPLTGPDELLRVAERIRNSFVRHVFCQGTHDLKVTVSVGAACGSGGIQEAQLTMTHADRALYRVKQMGRNGVHFWEGQSSDSMIPPHKTTPPTQLSSSGSNTRGRILVVDDDEAVSGYLKIFLHGEHFQVYVASNGAQARNIVDQERGRIDVAMVDLGLGAENGLEVLQNLREVDDTLVGLVMTGNATSTNAASALRSGASDFIEKPLDDSALAEAIQRAMRYRQLLQENRRYQRHLEDMVAERSAALSRTLTQVKQSYRNTLEVLAGILDVRESQTGEHCKRVAASARILAREMGMTEADIEIVGDGGLLHDIGKIAIPDAILLKPGPLTESEWAVVRNHSQLGYNIVSACPPLEQASEIVLSHQERFDGRGYPRALKGTEICLGARVFAVVDAYDAMRFDRPYSPSQSVEKATAEIVAQRGLQFDPDVVDAFLRCQPRMEQVIALTETSRK